jgi:hypothetical protein
MITQAIDVTGGMAAALDFFSNSAPTFLIRLAIDLVCTFALVRVLYFRRYQRSDLFFTYFSFNLIIFLITFMLNGVELTLGAAFGLFAVFSMLRFRTEGLSAKDMTYLFLVIAVGLIMAVGQVGWQALSLIGATIVAFAWLLESNVLARRELAQDVLYEKIEMVNLASRPALIEDLRVRTGLDVHRVDVREIDFVRDAARLTVYFYA